jgi:hypothetical protein
MKIDDVVDKYIKLRDKKAQLEADHKLKMANIDDMLDKVEAVLLQQFEEIGVDSVKTKAGTAFATVRTSATVADWDAFFGEFILPNKAWEFLERRCSKTAVEQYRSANEEIPPGINYAETRVINIRRAK